MKLTSAAFTLGAASLVWAAGNFTPDELAPIVRSCTQPNSVALTFNDGVGPFMYDIGKALAAAGAKGTFFLNGINSKCIYEDNGKRVRWLFEHGHQIASLTWDHASLPGQSVQAMQSEMSKVDDAFQKTCGVSSRFVRPPYGNIDETVQYAAHTRNVTLATWDYDGGDSGNDPNAQAIINGFRAAIAKKPHSMLVSLTETVEITAHQVVPAIIKMYQSAGYKLVTLAECLNEQPYMSMHPYPKNLNITDTC